MKAAFWRVLLWVFVFAVAMAFLETAVVVYLRKLYYPHGFDFPLRLIDSDIALTEFLRELATMIMLAVIGFVAGKTWSSRFAYFIFSFAVWDIFYYVFLYVLLGWPASLLTWDILFLIPVTWVGPVLAPLINSVMMILLALILLFPKPKERPSRIGILFWLLLIIGSLIVIVSYTEEYTRFMGQRFSLATLLDFTSGEDVIEYACTFIPRHFQWWLFSIGVAMHAAAMLLIWRKNRLKPSYK